MTRVVDASVLIAALVDTGPEGRWARAEIGEEDVAGPELALVEATNTLRRLEQTGSLSARDAANALRELVSGPLELHAFSPFAERVWELRGNLTSYDAWYVALAEALDCPLLTLDLRMSRSPGPACTFLTPPGEGV